MAWCDILVREGKPVVIGGCVRFERREEVRRTNLHQMSGQFRLVTLTTSTVKLMEMAN